MRNKIKAGMIPLAALAMLFTACGSSGNAGNNAGEQPETSEPQTANVGTENVALTVWAESDNFEMLNEMFETFKQEYAGQAVFDITLVEETDAETRNTLLADVHNGADVFSLPDDQLPSMIAAGAIAPVTDAEAVKNANIAEAIDAAAYNNVLYAFPYTADNGYFLYYNKDYYTETDVQTLDQILAIAEQNGKKFSMEFNSGWYLYSFFGGTGLEFGMNEDGVTNYCNWNSAEGKIKGVDIAQALLDITSSPAFLNQGDGDFTLSAANGDTIAGISGVWNAIAIKEAWGEDYGACKLPTYTCGGEQIQMSSFTGYKMMGVNAYSDHVDWALKLADWITNEANQTLRFEERNQGPSNINAAASEAVGEIPAIQAVIEQSQYGNLQRVGNSYWDACTEFAEIILAGNPDGKPLQEIMDNLTNGITATTAQ